MTHMHILLRVFMCVHGSSNAEMIYIYVYTHTFKRLTMVAYCGAWGLPAFAAYMISLEPC